MIEKLPEREGVRVAFLKEWTRAAQKTLIAFANTFGGDLYFGLNDDGTAEGLSKKDVDRISRSLHAFCAEETEPVMLDLISTKALSAGVGSYLLHANVLPGKDRPMRSRDNDTRAAPTSGTARPRSRPLKKKFAT